MTQKYTPGPWRTLPRGSREYIRDLLTHATYPTATVLGKDGRLICMTGFPLHSPSTLPEDQANAQLIAAAPNLLEELKMIEAGWAARRTGKTRLLPLTPWEIERLDFVRAAISAAEGGTGQL